MGHYRLHQVAWVTIDYVLGHYRCDARGRLRGSLRTRTMDECGSGSSSGLLFVEWFASDSLCDTTSVPAVAVAGFRSMAADGSAALAVAALTRFPFVCCPRPGSLCVGPANHIIVLDGHFGSRL